MSSVDIIQHFHLGQLHLSKVRKEAVLASGRREWTLVIRDFPDYFFWKSEIEHQERAQRTDFWSILKWKLSKLKLNIGLIDRVEYHTTLKFNTYFGVAITNPIDQYSKKEGLKLALERVRPVSSKIKYISMDKSTDITIVFTVLNSGEEISITLGSGGRTHIQQLQFNGPELYRLLHGEIKDDQVSNHQG
jgi:hypothetical protein